MIHDGVIEIDTSLVAELGTVERANRKCCCFSVAVVLAADVAAVVDIDVRQVVLVSGSVRGGGSGLYYLNRVRDS
jgi:hypothetical protein